MADNPPARTAVSLPTQVANGDSAQVAAVTAASDAQDPPPQGVTLGDAAAVVDLGETLFSLDLGGVVGAAQPGGEATAQPANSKFTVVTVQPSLVTADDIALADPAAAAAPAAEVAVVDGEHPRFGTASLMSSRDRENAIVPAAAALPEMAGLRHRGAGAITAPSGLSASGVHAGYNATVSGVDRAEVMLLDQNIRREHQHRPLLRQRSLRHFVKLRREAHFDVGKLPRDLQRVFRHVERDFGTEYALLVVFSIRTAVELHRAWHMTLLTTALLNQIKDRFSLRMTWDLGVTKLKFRIEDGAYELHRKVPYDYDSEFQDIYCKCAVSLIEGHINVHQALVYQTEIKEGKHTAKLNWFLRAFPGRLLLYPFESATCAIIFFGGDWEDAGVAAVCGLAAGMVDYGLNGDPGKVASIHLWSGAGPIGGVLMDVLVGATVGLIGGMFYMQSPTYCLSSIFLGTLYWFFYGTAFVLGLLEIIAGEMEVGVTRFMAVSVKTFVLCIGAGFGMMMVLDKPRDVWIEQDANCNAIVIDDKWWRIPMYLLCSAAAAGQYRFPVVDVWRCLIVQLVGYEVQYQIHKVLQDDHKFDNMDSATSNVGGAVASVIAAVFLAKIVDDARHLYYAKILGRDSYLDKDTALGKCFFSFMTCFVRFGNFLHLGRASEKIKLAMQDKVQTALKKFKTTGESDTILSEDEEKVFVETIVSAENLNIWAILMPAVYQLVPGSKIATMWFNSIFPPRLTDDDGKINAKYDQQVNVFADMMVISGSLALGLLLGFGIVLLLKNIITVIVGKSMPRLRADMSAQEITAAHASHTDKVDRAEERFKGMFSAPDEDPQDAPSRSASQMSGLSRNSAPSGQLDDPSGMPLSQVARVNVSTV